nr:MAG TPA: hypothetical protein [Caudoviricetes sp.]DAX78487.1 MAG TPA: hypothetical protein [Caudoviricetes sp.]
MQSFAQKYTKKCKVLHSKKCLNPLKILNFS